MRISAEQYMDASRQRMRAALTLREDRLYSDAIYAAGLSVECMLRAFIAERDPEFDSRHDLRDLFKKAGKAEPLWSDHLREADVLLGELWARWKNTYRFASDERLRSELRAKSLNRGIQADFLKENCRIVLESSLKLQQWGEVKWRSRKS